MKAFDIAILIEAKRTEVIEALESCVPCLEERKEIVGEIVRTKYYLRYMESLRNLTELGRKVAIVTIYEVIDEPGQALNELNELMYS